MATLQKRSFLEFEMSNAQIDEETGKIRGVKFLGLNSRNGRRYEGSGVRKAVDLYDGRNIYLGHPDNPESERKFDDWLGVSEDPWWDNGVWGNVQLRTKSPRYPEVIEAARNFSLSLGCSHVAEGGSRFEGGLEIIDEITAVHSIDLVMNPATTNGLFEGIIGAGDVDDEQSGDDDLAEFTDAVAVLRKYGADEALLKQVADSCQLSQAAVTESHHRQIVVPSFINASTFDSAAKFARRYR